jgi:hypothetical protein
MKKLTKISLSVSLGISMAIAPSALSPQSAQAITWEEAEQGFGVLYRYFQDINKTIIQPRNSQSAPEAPAAPPSSDESSGEEIQLTE